MSAESRMTRASLYKPSERNQARMNTAFFGFGRPAYRLRVARPSSLLLRRARYGGRRKVTAEVATSILRGAFSAVVATKAGTTKDESAE